MRFLVFRLVCLCLLSFFALEGCSRGKAPFNDPSELRGKSMEELRLGRTVTKTLEELDG